MDLTKTFPRSPKESMSGLVFLPRTIDKARAFKENTLGEFIYPCPLDKLILNFFNVEPEGFADRAESHSDEEVCKWLDEKAGSRGQKEKDLINRQILERKPDSEDRMSFFLETRNKIDSSRTDITTWVDLLDLEEGRI